MWINVTVLIPEIQNPFVTERKEPGRCRTRFKALKTRSPAAVRILF